MDFLNEKCIWIALQYCANTGFGGGWAYGASYRGKQTKKDREYNIRCRFTSVSIYVRLIRATLMTPIPTCRIVDQKKTLDLQKRSGTSLNKTIAVSIIPICKYTCIYEQYGNGCLLSLAYTLIRQNVEVAINDWTHETMIILCRGLLDRCYLIHLQLSSEYTNGQT